MQYVILTFTNFICSYVKILFLLRSGDLAIIIVLFMSYRRVHNFMYDFDFLRYGSFKIKYHTFKVKCQTFLTLWLQTKILKSYRIFFNHDCMCILKLTCCESTKVREAEHCSQERITNPQKHCRIKSKWFLDLWTYFENAHVDEICQQVWT